MNFLELEKILSNNPNKYLSFVINQHNIPDHFHITEVGKETRCFIDCGGTKRKNEKCVLQLWVYNDLDHRLDSCKFLKIINLGKELFTHDIPEVYIEYEKDTVSQYPIIDFEIKDQEIVFHLGKTHTACLAPDKCGVDCCKEQNVINIKY